MSSATGKQTTCPKCSNKLAPSGVFKPWCNQCNWGIEADEDERPGLIGRLYARQGEKLGQHLFDELINNPKDALRSRLTPSKVAAVLLSLPVHLATLTLFGLGIWCIVADWFNWFLTAIGLFLMVAAYALAPKLGNRPENVLERSEAPVLFGLVDEIASVLKTPTIDTISVSEDINAFYGHYGLPRRSVLTLGAPLWLTLNGPQKASLICHEMAHQVNGDIARSFWVGGAVNTLAHWHEFLTPPYEEGGSLADLAAHYFCWLLSWPVYFYMLMLVNLFWYDSQRAEYLADYLGSRVSGTDAYISSDEQIGVVIANSDKLVRAIRDHSLKPELIVPAFVAKFEDVPENEYARVRRSNEVKKLALDATHPPTHYRSELLRIFPCEAKIECTDAQSKAMNAEVANMNTAVGRTLVREMLADL